MLINCPKCGFSQPQDRYCASCGIDIENYKPVEHPFWKKILSNPFVHVGFIFVLVFISILFIRKQQREDLRARVEYLKGGPILVERQPSPGAPVPNSGSTATDSELPQNSPSVPVGSVANPTAVSLGTSSSSSMGVSPSSALATKALGRSIKNPTELAVKNGATKMVVTYAELDRVTLDAWLEEMRAAGQLRQFDTVSLGTLHQVSLKMKNARNLKVLQKVNRNLDPANPALEWFVGTHRGNDPENEIGLFSSLVMNNDSKDGIIHGELEVQRAFRDPKDVNKTMERVSFGGPFEVAPGAAYLMTGLIPRKFVSELDDEMNPDSFLSIFKSRPFLNRETEFTLILEFDTAPK